MGGIAAGAQFQFTVSERAAAPGFLGVLETGSTARPKDLVFCSQPDFPRARPYPLPRSAAVAAAHKECLVS
jgi:hypothetical protein